MEIGEFKSPLAYMIKGNIPQHVIEAIEQAWSQETAGIFYKDNPSKGQCAVTSMLIQDLYGGKLVRGTLGKSSHYWNELPDGTTVDLTRQQFGDKADELVVDGYRNRDDVYNGNYGDTGDRYEILKQRFEKFLNRKAVTCH